MSTYKEYVFDLADVKFMSVVCGRGLCKGEAIVNASNASAPTIPRACPSCKNNFEPESVLSDFSTFRNLVKTAVDRDATTGRIRIRVAK
jgi:hypothetical protein